MAWQSRAPCHRTQKTTRPKEQTPAVIENARLEAERLCRELEGDFSAQRAVVRTEAKLGAYTERLCVAATAEKQLRQKRKQTIAEEAPL